MKSAANRIPGIIFALILPAQVMAGSITELSSSEVMNIIMIVLILFIMLALAFLARALTIFVNHLRGELSETIEIFSWNRKLTDAVPVEKEESILFHHEYDGIRELDNNLPPWWVYMFYVTLVFAVIYLGYYHVYNSGNLQEQEYLAEMNQAELRKAEYLRMKGSSIDESNVEMLTDAALIENGKSIYAQNCSACHGSAGEGGVGPNLTDPYWIHGGGIKNIFSVIRNGAPEKGMIPWKSQLSPEQIQQVSSYIITLEGTSPENAKAPQGELVAEAGQ